MVALSIGGMFLAQRFASAERLESHNEVAGFVYAVVGISCAVLLAFLVTSVWEQHKLAETRVEDEADAYRGERDRRIKEGRGASPTSFFDLKCGLRGSQSQLGLDILSIKGSDGRNSAVPRNEVVRVRLNLEGSRGLSLLNGDVRQHSSILTI